MAHISDRAQGTQPSPIRKLKPLADEAHQAGKRIYHLNIGQPDIPTPKAFLDGIRDVPDVLAYSPSQGLDEAREALSSYYAHHDIELTSDQIVITAGGSEALQFALMSVLDPGDDVLIPEPFYANYGSFAAMAGLNVVPLSTRAEEGFNLPDREEMDRAVTSRTKALLLCNPGNPTGRVYTRDELDALKEFVIDNDLFLIADEVYREFVYDGLTHTSVLEFGELRERAILADSISKRFSACGARIGAVASHNDDVMASILKFAQARLSPPTLGQLGLIRFLDSDDQQAEVNDIIREFERRRDLLYEEIQEMPDVVCHKPQGAFYFMVKLPIDDAESFASWLLRDFDVDGETVMFAPAAAFYSSPGMGQDEVRIAYVLNESSLKRAMSVLQAGVEAYPGSRIQTA
ncbi:MAG: pyridoxal phosphate-dependent aminotransferase [Candidatus Bipolaricaulia bacterium]